MIGARESLDIYKFLTGLNPGEFDSARDNAGHGTHTASTAAGNAGVAAAIFGQPRGIISGIAPRAYVAAYKGLGDSGGYTADLVTAIEQAVADGVDIINYSIGSVAAANPYRTGDGLAFLDAYRAGVFVAVSAGNSGPNAGTVGSPANAPWVMSVAASTTDRRFEGRLTVRAGTDQLTLSGASITAGVAGRPIVDAAQLNIALCDGPLPAAVRDAIVLCRRGVNARVEKSSIVKDSGGAGMILYNPTPADVVSDNHWLPSIHIDAPAAAQLLAFTRAHSNTLVFGDIAPGQPLIDPQFGDIMAAFSSRGPLADDQLGISKPDLAAPGVQILAGHTPAVSTLADGPPGELFQAIAGTSMAAPHVAGAGALLKALHPGWSPGQIKSALMTTARTSVLKEDGVTPATPYDMGAGRIDLTQAGDPGLTFDVPADQYAASEGRLAGLNYPSISLPSMPGRQSITRTVASVLDEAAVWAASAEAPAGARISVTPAMFSLPAHGTATFTVTVDAGSLPAGTYFGRVLLQSGARTLHLPVSFVRRQPPVALGLRCDPAAVLRRHDTSCAIVATNNGPADATISLRATIPRGLSVRTATLVGGSYDHAARLVRFDGALPGYMPPTFALMPDPAGLPFGYVPLSSLGVAPSACDNSCDETAITFVTPTFSYAGATYDRATMTTNGYLIVGTRNEVRIFNQDLPDPTVPNNLIAPYWADLDLDGSSPTDPGAGAWYAAYVTAGPGSPTWFVAEWAGVPRYGRNPADSYHSFEVWIEGGSDRIHLVYGPNSPTEDRLTVGAENSDGTVGGNYYVDTLLGDGVKGRGTPPVAGDTLKLSAVPEQRSAQTIAFLLRGKRVGSYVLNAELTADTFDGVNVATQPLEVARP
ncbi:MAG: S8 family serine peptidase [Kouleothrix sp.]